MTRLLALSPLVFLAAAALVYGKGARTLRARSHGRSPTPVQVLCFSWAIATLAVVLAPGVDHLTGTSLPLHMAQHMLIWLVAAPLLVLSAPLRTFSMALGRGRQRAGRLVPRWAWRLRMGAATPVGLVGVWLSSTAVLWAWHVPPLYEAAVRHQLVHGVEHLTFFLAASAFWWALVGARRRAGLGAALLALILSSFQSAALGALLTFSAVPWYAMYPSLDEQRLAGLVMWVPGGVVYLVVSAVLFLRWLGSEPAQDPPATAPERVARPSATR